MDGIHVQLLPHTWWGKVSALAGWNIDTRMSGDVRLLDEEPTSWALWARWRSATSSISWASSSGIWFFSNVRTLDDPQIRIVLGSAYIGGYSTEGVQ